MDYNSDEINKGQGSTTGPVKRYDKNSYKNQPQVYTFLLEIFLISNVSRAIVSITERNLRKTDASPMNCVYITYDLYFF